MKKVLIALLLLLTFALVGCDLFNTLPPTTTETPTTTTGTPTTTVTSTPTTVEKTTDEYGDQINYAEEDMLRNIRIFGGQLRDDPQQAVDIFFQALEEYPYFNYSEGEIDNIKSYFYDENGVVLDPLPIESVGVMWQLFAEIWCGYTDNEETKDYCVDLVK